MIIRTHPADLVQLRNLSNSLLALFREKAKAVEEQKLVVGLVPPSDM